MLEKLNQLAEQAATNVSRRGFLGRIGRGAGAAAAAAAGLVILAGDARAGRKPRRVVCCYYYGGASPQCEYNRCPKFIRATDRGGDRETFYLEREVPCSSCDDCINGLC